MLMKAIRAHQWCDPEGLVMDEIERPEPGAGEVLIRVHAAALNFPDVLLIAGKYQVKPPLPFSPGMEVSGVVEKVGDGVSAFQAGQRVLAQLGLGGFAEYAVAPVAHVQALPAGMSDAEAASFGLVYQTSYFGIADRGQLRKGETVLVHSAAGGVGLAAVQIARALGAGRIIGTASADDKLAAILASGADTAINYQTEDFVEVVKRETAGRGADVIYDPVGGETGERSTKCIAFEGRLIIIGFTSGKFPSFAGNHILIKNYSVIGLHWGAYRQHNPAKIEPAWKGLFELYEAGHLKPVIGGLYPMAKVAEAMNFLTSRRATGKIVLHW
jgi:NADPH:quinone reductase